MRYSQLSSPLISSAGDAHRVLLRERTRGHALDIVLTLLRRRNLVDEVVLVDEKDIAIAMLRLVELEKSIVEGTVPYDGLACFLFSWLKGCVCCSSLLLFFFLLFPC